MVTANQPAKADQLDLMIKAKQGDRDAFAQLYEQYLAPVYRYVLVRVSDAAAAEDITQTVFLKVYQSLSRYQPRSLSPIAFFFTIAKNTIIDHWKKKKELQLNEAIELPDRAYDLTEQTNDKMILESIMNTLKLLTSEHQEILNLKFIAGLTNKEIAEFLGKNEAAVRQMQCRALKQLRQKLSTHLPFYE
jgi:RNA polymerase sigma-70 factor (ECF subfamily)